jgi:hypothetical protein
MGDIQDPTDTLTIEEQFGHLSAHWVEKHRSMLGVGNKKPAQARSLPPFWTEYQTDDGIKVRFRVSCFIFLLPHRSQYYYNSNTQETVWERPS